jgi:hypothetical protein
MTPKEIGISELHRNANEIAWRHVWLTNVIIDADKPILATRPRIQRSRQSLTQRLRKLRRMRAILEQRR